MMKTLRAACSVILCLSLLFSGTFTSVYAVGDTAAIATEPHAHIHSADPAPIADTNTVRTLYSKDGITVKIALLSDHFGSSNGAYVCETPDAVLVESADEVITAVNFYTAEWKKGETATDYKLAKDKIIEGCNAEGLNSASVTATMAEGTTGNVIIVITCGEKETEVSFAISHMMGGREGASYGATCTQKPRKETHYICKVCDIVYSITDSYDKNIPAKGHTFEDYTVTSTCEEDATITYEKCTECGFVQLKDGSNINNEKHSFTVDGSKEPTCYTDGVTYKKCENCDVIDPESVKTVESLSHNFPRPSDPTNEVIPPSCEEWGKIIQKCKNDGCNAYVETLKGSPKGHKWVLEGEYTVEPTCGRNGVGKAKCENCGEIDESHEFPAPAGHNFNVYKEILAPTCTADGYANYVCANCGIEKDESERVTLKALGHVPEADDNDCTTPVKCSKCGETVTEGKQEHKFKVNYTYDGRSHWRVCSNKGCSQTTEIEPHVRPENKKTCTLDFICSVCNKYIAGTPHKYADTYESDTQRHSKTCLNCGFVMSYPHTYVNDDNCSTPLICTVCNQVIAPARESHRHDIWINKGDYHESDCSNPYCTVIVTGDHTYGEPEVINEIKATCTTAGSMTLVYTCTANGCSARKVEEVTSEATGHSLGEWIVEEATCEDTRKYQECANCGEKFYDTDPNDGVHTWSADYVVTKPATCQSEGSEAIVCTVCGTERESRVVPMLAHSYDMTAPTRVEPATCVDSGLNHYACIYGCGTETAEQILPLGHTYGEYAYNGDADCQKAGTKTHRCSVCGAQETVDDPEHPQTEHSFTMYTYQNDATIDHDGTEVATCDYGCGATDTRTAANTKLHQHTFTNYVIVTEATCTTNAFEQAKCDICGTPSEIVEISDSALGHVGGAPAVVTPATCTEGAFMTISCERCGVVLESGVDENSVLGHSFTNYVYNNDATVDMDGTETAVCDRGCGAVDTRTKPGTKLESEHVFTHYVYNNDATCTNGTETAYCDNGCGTTHTREAVGTALGHAYGDPIVVTPATCTEAETVKYTCTRCGSESEITVLGAALGHDYESVVVSPATCTEAEIVKTVCSRCGDETKPVENGEPLGHDYGDPVVTPATCTEAETVKTVCSRCGAETEPIENGAPLGHDYGDPVVVSPATCTEDEVVKYVCSRCEEEYTETVEGTAKGHVSDDGTVTKEPTETEYGEKTYKCTVCGAVLRIEFIDPLGPVGDVDVGTESGVGAPEVSVDGEALADAVLTPEDEEVISNGGTIDIVLTVDDASATVSEGDIALTASVSEGYDVGRYLDINLTKYVNGVENKIEETNSAIRIVIEIPDDLLSETNRVYKIVKIHNGVPELLDDLDDVRNTITFETSEFSTYAIVMKDSAPAVTPPPVHRHAFAGWSYDSLRHWMQCMTCGMSVGYEPHTYVNGICSRCGFINYSYTEPIPETESGEEIIVVDEATEGSFGETDD